MTQRIKSFLRNQIIEMDRLAESSGDDPLMAFAIESRRKSLVEKLDAAPPEPSTPRAVLFFAGPPVFGSKGIDAKFAAAALEPFLEMVKTQYSAQKHGSVGARGRRRGEAEARLFLTGLPRGSFGLELSQPEPEDPGSAEELSRALVRLTDVIYSAGENDERFALSLDNVSPRVLPRLTEFLGVVNAAQANLGMESGDLKIELPPERVARAFERLESARTEDSRREETGIFRGATLDSWEFNFRLTDGTPISGRLCGEVDEGTAQAMMELTGKDCVADLHITEITTRDGATRRRYELLGLRPVPKFPRLES